MPRDKMLYSKLIPRYSEMMDLHADMVIKLPPGYEKPRFVEHKTRKPAPVTLPAPFKEVAGVREVEGHQFAVDLQGDPVCIVTDSGADRIKQLLTERSANQVKWGWLEFLGGGISSSDPLP